MDLFAKRGSRPLAKTGSGGTFEVMPDQSKPALGSGIHQYVDEVGVYPLEAYEFVQQGLSYTVQKIHGPLSEAGTDHHVSGQELCFGLRDFALEKWGMLAGLVLRRWSITSTLDFGRIVFTLVDYGMLRKTDEDSLEDFRGVFDFRLVFESGYRIPLTK
jgi:uncharacterized repeat protein (TIGR04138 family)